MAIVFRIRNPDGSIHIDLASRTFKLLTYTISPNGNNGTYSDPNVTVAGTVARVVPSDATKTPPDVTVNNGSLAWTFKGNGDTDPVDMGARIYVSLF